MLAARVNNYDVGEELYRTALGSVAMVKSGGGDSATRRVIKLFQPATYEIRDDTEGVETFLARAGLQKQLAAGGASHWAPVHDLGRVDGGAFFVTDLYSRSLQKLINGRVVLGCAELHALIRAVVAGLLEIEKGAARGHGALKATNVLIAGAPSLRKSKIVLSDPAAEMEKPSESDLAALGDLIHQVVLCRRFAGPGSWPVPAGAQWANLGSRGEGWRALCNRLLDPMPGKPLPKLEEVAASVRRLRPARAGAAVLAGGVIVGLVAAGAIGVAQLEHRNQAEFESARDTWLGPLASTLISERDAGKLDPANDASLLAMADQIQQHDLLNLQLPSAVIYKPDFAALNRSREAVALLHTLSHSLDEKLWQRLAAAKQLQAACHDSGLNQPAEILGAAVAQCATLNAQTADAVRALVEIRPSLSRDIQKAVDLSRSVDLHLSAAGPAGGDAFLARYSSNLKTIADSARQNLKCTPDNCVGLAALKAVDARASLFARVVDDARHAGWPGGLNSASFSDDVEAPLLNAPLIDASLHHWGQSIPDYVAAPVPADSPVLTGMRNRLAAVMQTAPAAPSFAVMADECRRQIEAFAARRFTRKELAGLSGTFVTAQAAPNEELQKLSAYGQQLNTMLRTAEHTGDADPQKGVALADELLGIDPKFRAAADLKSRFIKMMADAQQQQIAKHLANARNAETAQDLETAQAEVTAALGLDPKNADALALQSHLNGLMNDVAARKSQMQGLLAQARDKSDSSPYDALAAIAKLQRIDQTNAEAAALRAKILAALLASANAKEAAGDHDGALSDLGKLVSAAPDDQAASDRRNAIQQQRDQVRQKIADLSALISTSPIEAMQGIAALSQSELNNPALPKLRQEAEAAAIKAAGQLEAAGKLSEASQLLAASLQFDANQPDALRLQKEIAARMQIANGADKIRQLLAKAHGELASAPAQTFADANAVLALDKTNEEAASLRSDAIDAMVAAGDAYAARNTDGDFQNAATYYRLAADAGNVHAMSKLGSLYDSGKGVKQDSAQAFAWYRKAADAGDANAMFRVANAYLGGQGVQQDYAAAIIWCRKCADAGSVPAMNAIGDLFAKGQGVPQDYGQAMVWYQKAASAGSSGAMRNIGSMYAWGNGVAQDDAQARAWYQKAANAGDRDAQAWLDQHKPAVASSTPPNGHKKKEKVLVP